MPTRLHALKELLEHAIPGRSTIYQALYIDEFCVIFAATEKTGKVMLPTDLVLEWIAALEFGVIHSEMAPREMRDEVKNQSPWASHLHAFETHLHAIMMAWAARKNPTKSES